MENHRIFLFLWKTCNYNRFMVLDWNMHRRVINFVIPLQKRGWTPPWENEYLRLQKHVPELQRSETGRAEWSMSNHIHNLEDKIRRTRLSCLTKGTGVILDAVGNLLWCPAAVQKHTNSMQVLRHVLHLHVGALEIQSDSNGTVFR